MTTLGMLENSPMSKRIILGRYCPACDHTYFSRARHDFCACPCWLSSGRTTGGYIDGGRDYVKVGGKGITVRIEISQTDKELVEDWRSGTNKYGILKGCKGTPILGEKK